MRFHRLIKYGTYEILESDLEEIIMKTDNMKLYGKGLPIIGKKKNQVRIGKYGIADIVVYEKEPYTSYVDGKTILNDWTKIITVYELKKDKVSLSTFAQGIQYIKGIQDYFESTGRDKDDYCWRMYLIGREIDINSSIAYLPDITRLHMGGINVEIFKYEFNINGLSFHKIEGYSLIEKGF